MLWADAAAATPAGTVIGVSGSCTDQGRVLNRGDTIQIGDTLDVPAGGNLKLRMADGTTISVASGTSVTVTNYDNAGSGGAAKLLLTQGLVRVTSATHPLEVSTGLASRMQVPIPPTGLSRRKPARLRSGYWPAKSI
jgi:hypothetical protein